MLGRLAERYGSARHEMRGGSLGMGVGSNRWPRPTADAVPSRIEEGWPRSDSCRFTQVRRDSCKSRLARCLGALVQSLQPPLFYSIETLRDILSTDVSTGPHPVGSVRV